ncbi:MAG: MBL fold metallo-hydrolase [Treponema sp.]|nr:MBL fold metallo-hydrolase [Treponema sp.]
MSNEINRIVVGPIETNCWLYPMEEGGSMRPCVVIDPGGEAEKIISRLKELNWFPAFIFLTHGHFDHLMALPDLIEAFEKGTFGNKSRPQIGIHRLDAHYTGKNAFKAHAESFAAAGGDGAYLDSIWKPMPDADILFEDKDAAGPFKVLHVPGHTQGSVCLYDEKAAVLFSGDTLFKGDFGRSDLPGGSRPQIKESIRGRLFTLEGEITVYPGHGSNTSIKEERENLDLEAYG